MAAGTNCTAVGEMLPVLTAMATATPLPFVAYANNAWYEQDSAFLAAEPVTPDQYGFCALGWITVGARLMGGCCGTGPGHIAALASQVLHRRS